MEVQNAIISETFLGYEEHGNLTFQLYLRKGNSVQAFGGYRLNVEHIQAILKTLKVSSWEELPGTPCRIRADDSHIEAIGHFMINEWFQPNG